MDDERDDRGGNAVGGLAVLGVLLLVAGAIGLAAGLSDASDRDMTFAETLAWAGAAGGPFLIAGCVCVGAAAIASRLDRRP